MTTTTLTNARHYTLSSTISCGYNFLKKVFYVTNRGYTTEREDGDIAWEAVCAVCDTAITSNSVSVEEGDDTTILTKTVFLASEDTVEPISSLAYTYSDNGEYIKSVKINDYSDYLLCMDCDNSKLYVKNTDVMYDLSLDEAANLRVDYITLFYKQQLGLGHIVDSKDILIDDIRAIYNLLVTYYAPTVYNSISKSTEDADVLIYNNTISLSNYNKKGKATYDITCNPDNTYSVNTIASIKEASVSENTFTLTGVPNTTISIGDTVYVSGADNVVENVTYSADGTYTVKSYDNVTLEVEENIPYSYSFPFRNCYLVNSQANITNISRTDSSITLSSTVPNTIKVGDTIKIRKTTQVDQSESITDDGEYQVQSFSGSKVYIYPEPAYNYTYNSSAMTVQGDIVKEVYLGDITGIEAGSSTSSTLTLDRSITALSSGDKITIYIGDISYPTSDPYTYTVTASTTTTVTFTNTESDVNHSYTPDYADLQKHGNSPLLLLNVLTSKKESLLPTGELMLDDLSSLQKYLSISNGVLQPTSTNTSAVGSDVPTTKSITLGNSVVINMTLEGLYSEVYTD